MLKNISWGGYWIGIISVVAIYYTAVILLLYRNGLLSSISLKPLKGPKTASTGQMSPFSETHEKTSSAVQKTVASEIAPQMDALVGAVLDFLQEISGKSYVKEEIIMGLQIIMREHNMADGNPYQAEINTFLVTEMENYCSVHLSETDLTRIWKG